MQKIAFVDGTKVSSAKVTIDEVDYPVTPARYTGATPLSSTVLNTMQDNIEDAIDQNADNIGGEEYDDTATYEVGDIVKYEGQLYICTTAVETPEDFDSTKWNATDVLSSAGGNEIAIGSASDITGKTKIFVDESTQTLQYKDTTTGQFTNIAGDEVFIGDIEDVPEDAKLVIDDEGTDLFSSEVVNSLSGDETAKAPSVHAVKNELEWKKATGTTIPECNEAVIYVNWGNGQYNIDFFVNYSYLQTGDKNFFNGGYRNSSSYIYCWLKIINNVVSINVLADESGNISNPSIDIYYK